MSQPFEQKQIYHFITEYWSDWFLLLPSYQTFCDRLNLLEQTLQSIGAELMAPLLAQQTPELDRLADRGSGVSGAGI